MRTTLVLDDKLVRRAKRRAVERDSTLSEVVNEALRASLARLPPEAEPLRPVTYGSRRRRVEHEPADFARELDREDREALRRRC